MFLSSKNQRSSEFKVNWALDLIMDWYRAGHKLSHNRIPELFCPCLFSPAHAHSS